MDQYIDIEKENYLREYKDEKCFSWEYIYLNGISKEFIIEFKEYLHPKYINSYTQKWKRINEIVNNFGEDWYREVFDNYGYLP